MSKIGLLDAKEQFGSYIEPQVNKMMVLRDLFQQADEFGQMTSDVDLKNLMRGMHTIFDEIIDSLKSYESLLNWLHENEGTDCPIDSDETTRQARR